MRYLRSYGFVWDNPNGALNLLWLSVFLLIPGLGLVVLLGYAFEIVEALHCRCGNDYPDFACARLLKYLARGFRPFVVLLAGAVPFSLLAWLLGLGTVHEFAQVHGGAGTELDLVLVNTVACFLLIIALFGLTTSLAGLALFTGLSQEWALDGARRFCRDFIRRVGKELVLVQIFVVATAPLLGLLGSLLCGIGLLPSVACIVLAQHHLLYQLYELYLQRGGQVIPLTVEDIAD